jgi:uncharacterized protein
MASPYEDDILSWRKHRIARLTGPEGWLTVVGLAWLEEGDNPVGSDPANRVLLSRGPDLIGTITVEGGRVAGRFDPKAGVLNDGHPVTAPLDLDDDSGGSPTTLRLGTLTFFVIRRAGRLAVRIRDEESPARAAFTGIDSFPIDGRWRFQARFEPYDPPRTAEVPTIVELEETYQVPGALAFDHDGETHRIDAFLEEGETDLFLVFGDLTNRAETYGGGRYMYVRPPHGRGVVTVDFNKAYNPPCVFTPFATCALPPIQNRLPIRVEAGEKLYRGPGFSPVTPRG